MPHQDDSPLGPAMRSSWLGPVMVSALVVALFVPTIIRLVVLWELDPNYSHGYLVPFLGCYLLYRALKNTSPGEPETTLGITEALTGGFLLLVLAVIPWPLLAFAALFLLMRGSLLCLGGDAWARAGLVPTLFFFFMFPLPSLGSRSGR